MLEEENFHAHVFLSTQVCGYTPILGLVIYDCLPDYAVPEFWRRPLMGPGLEIFFSFFR